MNVHVLILISDNLLPTILYCPNNCGRHYSGKKPRYSLNRHITYECGIDPQFHCVYCAKSFTTKTNLKRHFLEIHKTLL